MAACRACRAAVHECNSRATNSARQNCRAGRRSRRCRRDWHRVCGLEKKKQDNKEGRSSGSHDCANALHDGDAQRRSRPCDGAAHGGVSAYVIRASHSRRSRRSMQRVRSQEAK
eukprot:2625106-Pleurochrysis_carterae.AAC.1